MKIFTEGLGLQGRLQLNDPILDQLAERFRSEKLTYYELSLESEQRDRCDSYIIPTSQILDWILEDTEILERNLYNDAAHTPLLQRALEALEGERPLSQEGNFSEEERRHLRGLNLATARPGRTCDVAPDPEQLQQIVRELHSEIGLMFFYTAGKSEARVWEMQRGGTASAAAGRIHSDLERGFIRAEIYNSADLDKFQTPQEAKSAGLLALVDRDYVMVPGDVIDVKFNV